MIDSWISYPLMYVASALSGVNYYSGVEGGVMNFQTWRMLNMNQPQQLKHVDCRKNSQNDANFVTL